MVAYFSMEIGLDPGMPTYAGGLGVLAGDTIRSGASKMISKASEQTSTRHSKALDLACDSDDRDATFAVAKPRLSRISVVHNL